VNGYRRFSAKLRDIGGFSLGTRDAARTTALLLSVPEATSADPRSAPPALPVLVASAPYRSWQRSLSGAFDPRGAATYTDTSVAQIGATMLHARACQRSLGHEEGPTHGRKVRRPGERSDAREEPPASTKSFQRAQGASHADDEPPTRTMSFATRALSFPRGR